MEVLPCIKRLFRGEFYRDKLIVAKELFKDQPEKISNVDSFASRSTFTDSCCRCEPKNRVLLRFLWVTERSDQKAIWSGKRTVM